MKYLKASTMDLTNAIMTNRGLKCNRFLIKVCGLNNWIITVPTFCGGKRREEAHIFHCLVDSVDTDFTY